MRRALEELKAEGIVVETEEGWTLTEKGRERAEARKKETEENGD